MTKDPILSSFAAELERWTRRPPAHPPWAARARVSARLGDRPPKLPLKVAATAALLLGMALGFFSLLLQTGPPPEIPDRRRPSVIVFQLQSGTRIYFALPPEGATKGEQP